MSERPVVWFACAWLLLGCVSAGISVPSAYGEHLTRRHAAVVAHFDSLVGRVSPDSTWRWIGSVEERAGQDSGLRVVTGVMRARMLMQRGNAEQARALAATALAHARAGRDTLLECRALYVQAMSYALAGERIAARPIARRLYLLAHAARLPRDEAQAHLTLAYLDLLAERYASAERGYRDALRAYSPELDVVPRRIARVGLARACFQQGRVDQARRIDIELIRESRTVDDPMNEAVALNNLAVHEFLGGDPADAVPSYRRALMLQSRMGRWYDAATTATNLATALSRLGRLDDAAGVLESFADTVRAGVQKWQRADMLSALANVRERQGRNDQAEALSMRAWALCDSAHMRPGRQLVAGRARLLGERGRVDEAVALIDRWVAAIPASETDPDDELMVRAAQAQVLDHAGRHEQALRRWTDVRARMDTTSSLGHVKQGYALLGESVAALGARDISLARARFRSAVRAWELGREGFRSPQWRETLEFEGVYLWGSAAGSVLAVLPGERPEPRVAEAFDLLQRLKARTLGERMAGANRPVTAAELRSRVLRAGELALDFYPTRDSVIVLAATRHVLRAYVIPDRMGLLERVTRFAGLARESGTASVAMRENAAASLSRDLLGPVADLVAHSQRLIVCGDGVVDQLPWALLPECGAARAPLTRMDVAGVPSLSALARLRGTRTAPARTGPLVLAGPTGPDGRALDGVQQETAFLRGHYAGTEVRTPHSGAEVRSALAAMADVGVVHVAAHFVADAEDPWHTGVLLGDYRRDDAWVRPAALAALHTRARLVVLAGCTSAGSQGAGLRGQRGLATAFLGAGAGAVLGTLWPVEDGASADFVRLFYRQLDDGHDAAQALALAQSAMRTLSGGQDASRWAGFVLVGDPAVRAPLPRRELLKLPGFGKATARKR